MRSAKELIQTILDSNLSEKAQVFNGLFNSWTEIVQDRVSAHSRILDIKDKTVVVLVDHPSWIMVIQANSVKYLNELRRRYPHWS
jgi:hypothetical protein